MSPEPQGGRDHGLLWGLASQTQARSQRVPWPLLLPLRDQTWGTWGHPCCPFPELALPSTIHTVLCAISPDLCCPRVLSGVQTGRNGVPGRPTLFQCLGFPPR